MIALIYLLTGQISNDKKIISAYLLSQKTNVLGGGYILPQKDFSPGRGGDPLFPLFVDCVCNVSENDLPLAKNN